MCSSVFCSPPPHLTVCFQRSFQISLVRVSLFLERQCCPVERAGVAKGEGETEAPSSISTLSISLGAWVWPEGNLTTSCSPTIAILLGFCPCRRGKMASRCSFNCFLLLGVKMGPLSSVSGLLYFLGHPGKWLLKQRQDMQNRWRVYF